MRFGSRINLMGLLVASGLLVMSSAVHAATATWSVSASIGEVDTELQSYFSIGDSVSGFVIIEEQPACTSTITVRNYCRHFGAIQSLDLYVGSHGFSGTDPNSNGGIEIYDSLPGTGRDDAFIIRFAVPTSSTSDFGAVEFNNLSMTLRDVSGSAITSTALSLTPPDVSLFDLTEFRLSFAKYTPIDENTIMGTSHYVIANDLHFVPVQTVPLPSTLILLASGVGCLFMGIKSRRYYAG
jgi:hypothetical protein